MELRVYLAKKRMKVNDLAEKIGCSYTHLLRIKAGTHKPSLVLAKAIERETNGEVTVKDLMENNEE